MVRATWRGTVLAEADGTAVVEGNHYFPAAAIRKEHLRPAPRQSLCPSKGLANYYDVVVDGEVNQAAAWYYADPPASAAQVRDCIAFCRGVRVEVVEPALTA